MAGKAWILVSLASALQAGTAAGGGGPHNVLLLINEGSADSVKVGEHYAAARSLHPRNVLRLRTTAALEAPFQVYEDEIRAPVLSYLRRSGLEPQIDYLVATQGFPLRLVLPPGSRQKHLSLGAALQALDTEIAGLPQSPYGRENPYFDAGQAFSRDLPLKGGHRIRLATMLAGFTAADAMALVDRALQAEGNPPPAGLFLFQDAQGNAQGRNIMYDRAIQALQGQGLEARRAGPGPAALAELPPVIAWFSGGSYSGLTREAIRGVTFRPGAVVDMLQSFGAVPGNFDPAGRPSQVPVAWAVEAGATGVHGAVAEPFTVAFPDPGTALLYAGGFNLAESFFGRIRTFWWQNLLLGDPLCAPFARPPEVSTSLESLLPGPVGGLVQITVVSNNLTRTELYVEGLRVDRARPGEPLEWNTLALPDGPARVRVVAVASGPAAVQAARTAQVPVFNPSFRILGLEVEGGRPVAGPLDGLTLRLSRRPALPAPAGAVALLDPEGRPLPLDVLAGAAPHELRLLPLEPLPASAELTVAIQGLADPAGRSLEAPFRAAIRTTAAALALTGPAEIEAGQPARLKVQALAAAGANPPHDRGYAGTLRIRATDPGAEIPPPAKMAGGAAEAALVLRTAGDWEVRATDPETGLEGRHRIKVLPGPFARGRLELPREWPAGHALAAGVVGLDACGNPTPRPSPELNLEVERSGPVAVALVDPDQGKRTVQLAAPWRDGEVTVRLVGPEGKEMDQGRVRLTPGPVRRFLRLGPFRPAAGARPEPPPLPHHPPDPGEVLADRVWLPEESSQAPVRLPWLGEGQAGWVAVPLVAAGRAEVVIRINAIGTAATLHLDGRRLESGGRAALAPGCHWVGVALVRDQPGEPAFALELTGPGGEPPVGLCIHPWNPLQRPDRPGLSGRLRVGSQGLPEIKVELTGPGGSRTARTGEEGFFAFPRLAPGSYRLRPQLPGRQSEPEERNVTVADQHLWGLDFVAADRNPPEVKILSPRPGASERRSLRVRAQVKDDLGVAQVRWLIDGKEAGPAAWSPPWEAALPLDKVAPGRHQLAVVARDHAGNEARAELSFTVR